MGLGQTRDIIYHISGQTDTHTHTHTHTHNHPRGLINFILNLTGGGNIENVETEYSSDSESDTEDYVHIQSKPRYVYVITPFGCWFIRPRGEGG